MLPVPLLEPDPDAPLDLGKAIAACYERGAYDVIIDYRRNPPPPKLAQEELLALKQHLHKQGLR